MKNGSIEATEHHCACRRVRARFRRSILRRYVSSKLRTDPMFPVAYELLRDASDPIIDLGCGVGLLAFYLRERGVRTPILGIDCDAGKIARAKEIGTNYKDIEFVRQDARQPLPGKGTILLFDLLHYLQPGEQADLLEHLADCVTPNGMLLLRDCPVDKNLRYWFTYLAERLGQMVSWNLAGKLHYPSRESIVTAFADGQFSLTIAPLWGGTPFNSHLFLFRSRLTRDSALLRT